MHYSDKHGSAPMGQLSPKNCYHCRELILDALEGSRISPGYPESPSQCESRKTIKLALNGSISLACSDNEGHAGQHHNNREGLFWY